MSEEMQPIDPVTAAMLMGKTPEPCEPITEISHKVLTRLMDVVEFGDQLERVEKDRLLAHLKEVLAADQPELWVIHSVGPNELHPMISKEAAEQHATELAEMFKEASEKYGCRFDVIPSPFSPLEHFEILAEETIDHRDDLLAYIKELEQRIASATVSSDLIEALNELISASRSVNRGKHFEAKCLQDSEPCYWQRKEWVDWLIASGEAASRALAVITASAPAPAVAMPPEISRALLGKIVDELFGGAIEDPSAIKDVYRVIAREHLTAPAVVNQQLTTATPSKTCTWKLDWETGAYKLGCCNQTWHFTDGTAEENGAIFCHHCAGEIVADEPVLRAYQVGDNDIVAAYDPAGARKVLCEFNGYPDDQYEDSEVELVSDKVLDNTEAFDIDEGKTITLEKTLRQELAELTEPAYLHGWE